MNDIVRQEIDKAQGNLFPTRNEQRITHWLNQVAQVAYREGRNDALMGIMTAEDVAMHYNITPRRARALIRNRHDRFGVGMKAGNVWLISRDELHDLEPDARYK